jgi:hypothetical protein
VTDKIMDRIRRLLAQAEGTNNEHEAATFWGKAQELMAKHAIDEAMIAASTPKDQRATPIVRMHEMPSRQLGVKAQRFLLFYIVQYNRCRVLRYGPQSSTKYAIIGFEADVDFCIALFNSLKTQMMSELNRHRQFTTVTQKNSFMHGFAQRVGERLRDNARMIEAGSTISSSTALVLRDRSHEVERAVVDAAGGRLRSAGQGKPGQRDSGAVGAGRAAGDRASLNASRGELT